jgi:hypothetical protein
MPLTARSGCITGVATKRGLLASGSGTVRAVTEGTAHVIHGRRVERETLRITSPTFVVFVVGFVIIFALLNFLAAVFLRPLYQSLTSHLYS